MSDTVAVVTDATFDEAVLKSDLPVVVDYWAPWCGPCGDVAPVVEALSKAYAGKVRFVKLNVDENPDVTRRMGIRGLPTLMLLNGGEVVNTKVGAMPQAALTQWLDGRLTRCQSA
ncbi:MAG: thioredoxin [Oceanospirillaceae bacterium]|nr:thioredoxin [Oceanospirillaceae bacterium]